MTPNPNKRKGSNNRKPSGERERNIGHPNGEEHGRRPKGNRGIRRMVGIVGTTVTVVAVVWIVGNDITGIGAADDAALIPTIGLLTKFASMV